MRAHFAAVKARLESDPTLTGKVFDTANVDAAGAVVRGNYVLLFGGGPDSLDDDRLSAPQSPDSDADYTYTVRCVSTVPDVVRSMQSKVVSLLAGHRLVVPSRDCPPAEIEAYPVEWDTTLKPPLYFADVDIELHSSRAVL